MIWGRVGVEVEETRRREGRGNCSPDVINKRRIKKKEKAHGSLATFWLETVGSKKAGMMMSQRSALGETFKPVSVANTPIPLLLQSRSSRQPSTQGGPSTNLGCAQCQRASLVCTGSLLYPRTTNFNLKKKRHCFGFSNVPGKIIKK